MRRISTATSALAAFLFLGSAALADVTVCNDFRAPIQVAFANQDQGNFTAAGWWRVEPNDCQAVSFAVDGTTFYYAADSDEYRIGRTINRDHWGNKLRLFVTSRRFDFDNAERARRGSIAAMFSQADITAPYPGKPVTITLRFAAGNTTLNVKTGP